MYIIGRNTQQRLTHHSPSRLPTIRLSGLSLAALFLLTLAMPAPVQAKTFHCRAGNVSCLIASVKQANVQPGNAHEIRLAAGVYTLTAVDNETDGPNGLPSITSHLTIRGAGDGLTILERNLHTHFFRLIHVAATGALTLQGLALRGGGDFLSFHSHGGGLYNAGGMVTILNSTFVDNAGYHGGGVYSAGGTLTIVNSSFLDNWTNVGCCGMGGGLLVTGGTTMTIAASTLAGNSGYTYGGGLYIGPGAAVSITNSAIVDNSTIYGGGGLYNGGTLTIANSTIAGNFVWQGRGGGISTFGVTHILNATIVANAAYDNVVGAWGGGVLGQATLRNTILAHNTANDAPSDCAGPMSQGHNLIGDPAGCDMTLLSSDLWGEPGLGAFVDDPAPGRAHYLLVFGSQAINAGDDAACVPFDQLGQACIEICDIGAIEFQGEAVSRW